MTTNEQKHRRRGAVDPDGIYRRRKLVTIELDAFQGDLYARSDMAAITSESPGFLGHGRKDLIERHFIVTTRRYGSGGRWEAVVIDVNGNTEITMPEEVLEALRQQRESILDAQRKDNAAGRTPPVRNEAANRGNVPPTLPQEAG